MWRTGPALTIVALVGTVARGGPATVTGTALPSRAGSGSLEARAERLAARLANRLGAQVISPAIPNARLADALRGARELLESGAIDEAAQSLDLAIDGGFRAPDRIQDRSGFLDAVVVRIGIGLARSESARTTLLLERLLHWDPGFVLNADEESPALRSALERMRSQVGSRPRLEPTDLGQACHAADSVIVVRSLGAGVEVSRVDSCQMIATTTMRSDDEALLALARPLGPGVQTPLFRKTWLWTVVGAATIASVAVLWQVERSGGGFDVHPHL